MSSSYHLEDAVTDVAELTRLENELLFTSFTADDAWALGSLLRSRLAGFERATCVDITLANGTQLFRTAVKAGVMPDNSVWVARKMKTVLRFGASTFLMHHKMAGDEAAFAAKFALGNSAGEYAIHGGGYPIKVHGVEGVVGTIIVSGLKHDQDHQVIYQTVRDYIQARVDDGVAQADTARLAKYESDSKAQRTDTMFRQDKESSRAFY